MKIPEESGGETFNRFTQGCGSRLIESVGTGVFCGGLIGTGLMAWYPDPYQYVSRKQAMLPMALDVRYVVRGLRRPILWATLLSTTYSGVECTMDALRDETNESTWLNSAIAGAMTGMVMASISKRFDIMVTTGLSMGMVMGMIEYNGPKGKLGTKQEMYERKRGDTTTEKKATSPTLSPPSEESESTTATPWTVSEAVKNLKEKYPEFKDI